MDNTFDWHYLQKHLFVGGNLVSNPKQVLFSLKLVAQGAGLILKVLLNLTSGRNASYTMVHPYLGQVLIRQGWEASLPDMELSKTLRIRPAPHAANSEEDNTWLGFKTKFPPTTTLLNKINITTYFKNLMVKLYIFILLIYMSNFILIRYYLLYDL